MNSMSLTGQNQNVSVVEKRSATIHLVQSSQFARRLARLLVLVLFAAIAAMAFLPWQQTSRGTGRVVAFVPQERQQLVQAQAAGVVARIAEGLVEGSEVKKGDFLMEIQPFAANQVEQLESQLKELKTKEETSNVKAEAYSQNVIGFTEARDFAVSAAEQMVESAKAKLTSKQKLVPGYKAKEWQSRLNMNRQKDLMKDGATAEKEVEIRQKEWEVAKADLESLHDEVKSLEKEVTAKEAELEEKRRVAQTKIDYARAMQQDALGLAATARKEITDIEIKLEELRRLTITAPRDGTILRIPVNELGQSIKKGDTIVEFVPEVSRKAVELYVNGNDMPLVEIGQEVRLQFEGWPAVQFAGWPSVAVGTFSGKVTNVDATDNGKGQFRILVTPNGGEKSWPSDRFLRQGVRANGWVLLKRVSLGYEIWRQLNGFPVIVSDEEPNKKSTKTPKLPK